MGSGESYSYDDAAGDAASGNASAAPAPPTTPMADVFGPDVCHHVPTINFLAAVCGMLFLCFEAREDNLETLCTPKPLQLAPAT